MCSLYPPTKDDIIWAKLELVWNQTAIVVRLYTWMFCVSTGNWCSLAINYMYLLCFLYLFQTKSIVSETIQKTSCGIPFWTWQLFYYHFTGYLYHAIKNTAREERKAIVKLMVLQSIFPLRTAHISHWLHWPLYFLKHGLKLLCNVVLWYAMEYPMSLLYFLKKCLAHVYIEKIIVHKQVFLASPLGTPVCKQAEGAWKQNQYYYKQIIKICHITKCSRVISYMTAGLLFY